MTGNKHPEHATHKPHSPHSVGPDSEKRGSDGRSGQPHDDVPLPEATSQPDAEADSELKKENAELKDRLLRALADAENTRRRAERDLNDMRQYAITQFAGDMLPIVDYLERAIASVPAHMRTGEGAVKTLIDGVKLTGTELLRSLEKHGVKKLDPIGERFDPHYHEAVFAVPDPTIPNGTVAKVLEPGYTIGARSLRPAKVGVSNGGPDHRPPAKSPGSESDRSR